MNKFVKLMDAPGDGLWHGNILRLKAKWPYENVVDFMVFDTLDEERPSGLIVTSGHKAGFIFEKIKVSDYVFDTGVLRMGALPASRACAIALSFGRIAG